MDKLNEKVLTKQIEKQQIKNLSYKNHSNCCPNCGFVKTPGAKFCEQCGFAFDSEACLCCNASVKSNWEICPHCGQNLKPALCSFCGKGMDKDEKFCQHCGNSREGIVCTKCGTRNFRNFCFKCNSPLNELAQDAVKEAHADKHFQKILELSKELAQLEDELTTDDTTDYESNIEFDDSIEPKKEIIINDYLSGLLKLASTPPIPRNIVLEKTKKREKLAVYEQKVAQMQELMDRIGSPADAPPCIQRDYYSARKVPVLRAKVITEPTYWVCNLCGMHHTYPADCAQPELGGKWVYKNITITEEHFEYEK